MTMGVFLTDNNDDDDDLRPISYENGKVLLTLTMGDPFAMTMGVFLTDNNDDDDDDDNNHNGTEFQHV